MKKSSILFILFFILTILGLIEVISGFVLWQALPRGASRGGIEQVFWNLSRDTWLSVHDWVGVALVVLVIIHILLHWKWIIRMFGSHFMPNRTR